MSTALTPLAQALATPDTSGQGMQELLKSFEMMTKRNSQKLKDMMKAFKAVKTPQDFMELQKKLMTDGMADAAADSAKIGELAKIAMTAAFEPMRKKISEMQAGVKR